MSKILKSGSGWRIGWNPEAGEFPGLVGGENWAVELTAPELNDFCRLLAQLAATLDQMSSELMDAEKIACEAESDLLWMEVAGYPHAYTLQFILNSGRRAEGSWGVEAVPPLVQAAQTLQTF